MTQLSQFITLVSFLVSRKRVATSQIARWNMLNEFAIFSKEHRGVMNYKRVRMEMGFLFLWSPPKPRRFQQIVSFFHNAKEYFPPELIYPSRT